MWRQLVSIEEKRVSALILGFLLTLAYCMVMYAVRKELDPAWVDILQAIIAGVVGVGGVNALKEWAIARGNNGKEVNAGADNRDQPPI